MTEQNITAESNTEAIKKLESNFSSLEKKLNSLEKFRWTLLASLLFATVIIALDFAVISCPSFQPDIDHDNVPVIITCLVCIHVLAIAGLAAAAFLHVQSAKNTDY